MKQIPVIIRALVDTTLSASDAETPEEVVRSIMRGIHQHKYITLSSITINSVELDPQFEQAKSPTWYDISEFLTSRGFHYSAHVDAYYDGDHLPCIKVTFHDKAGSIPDESQAAAALQVLEGQWGSIKNKPLIIASDANMLWINAVPDVYTRDPAVLLKQLRGLLWQLDKPAPEPNLIMNEDGNVVMVTRLGPWINTIDEFLKG